MQQWKYPSSFLAKKLSEAHLFLSYRKPISAVSLKVILAVDVLVLQRIWIFFWYAVMRKTEKTPSWLSIKRDSFPSYRGNTMNKQVQDRIEKYHIYTFSHRKKGRPWKRDLILARTTRSVFRGSDSPPDCHSLPLPLQARPHTNKKSRPIGLLILLVRETGLEPVHQRYTPLKRARLPIPPLPRTFDIIS